MNAALMGLFGMGFLLGLRHAFDADHIAAIAALNTRNSLKGIFWGIGHTISLLAAGVLILIFKIAIPEKVALSLEFLVGIMLVILGLNALIMIKKNKFHLHKHRHGTEKHIHLHSHLANKNHSHEHKPLVVGLIHGMAGSAALTLLVLSAIDSITIGLLYILIFGIGSIIGMVMASSIISLPLNILARKFYRADKLMKLGAGIFSLLLGITIIYSTMLLF